MAHILVAGNHPDIATDIEVYRMLFPQRRVTLIDIVLVLS
jgi:hypothetical protein